nr:MULTISPECIES: hypothetical protein [unclassified Paraburkholderia]
MVLSDQIVQILREADCRAIRKLAIDLHITRGPGRGIILIERNCFPGPTLTLDDVAEKGPIYRSVPVRPFAMYLHVTLELSAVRALPKTEWLAWIQ